MQCSCGGSTVSRELPKVKGGKVISKMEFSECTACGRVGPKTMTTYDSKGRVIGYTKGEVLLV